MNTDYFISCLKEPREVGIRIGSIIICHQYYHYRKLFGPRDITSLSKLTSIMWQSQVGTESLQWPSSVSLCFYEVLGVCWGEKKSCLWIYFFLKCILKISYSWLLSYHDYPSTLKVWQGFLPTPPPNLSKWFGRSTRQIWMNKVRFEVENQCRDYVDYINFDMTYLITLIDVMYIVL